MKMSRRADIDAALHDARVAAYLPGQFVGQESFMTADAVLALARNAGIDADTRVLDVCCGIGGPGRLVVRTFGCTYSGVDADAEAVALARELATGLPCTYSVGSVPPLPAGTFDVVLLLETVLAFHDKRALAAAVAAALDPGGRFACTLEAGMPLTPAESAVMPAAETVWPVPLAEFTKTLADVGLSTVSIQDDTATQLQVVTALLAQFTAHRDRIAAALGTSFTDGLLESHRLWRDWMSSGRIRKFALVARRMTKP
ncbi:methyltransferase domain-containing protein [Herbiconiux sp. CPCC 205763]|uniref:Methyltransferase domain-containing protein n=1 Tax=Herbiconiux aconitum TaxID=2970913 RepID=A0ABT2GY30_9MICO|nr:class I SAM-dependent methyltransferase [Herbiconiux aconitum]MCS5720210.1 methyltransferase domain-containing protein [Herbiconiux aconitum]